MFTFTFLFVLFVQFSLDVKICSQDHLQFKMFLTPLIKRFHAINNIIVEANSFFPHTISDLSDTPMQHSLTIFDQ